MPGEPIAGDMLSAIAYFQRRYLAIPAHERAAREARERTRRAILAKVDAYQPY